ncbi:MAG: GNAT family N-acetyltransferase [Betaproteobacteria bacterium]
MPTMPTDTAGSEVPMQALTTERLLLEPLVVAHAPSMFPVLADAAIYRHLDYGQPPSLDYLRDVYGKLELRKSPDGSETWLNWIVCPLGKPPVGFVQATVFSPASAWVAYVLGSAHWGQGYAIEATTAMVGHLGSAWGITRCLATVEVANAPSIRLLERLAFHRAGNEEAEAHDLLPTELLFVRARG